MTLRLLTIFLALNKLISLKTDQPSGQILTQCWRFFDDGDSAAYSVHVLITLCDKSREHYKNFNISLVFKSLHPPFLCFSCGNFVFVIWWLHIYLICKCLMPTPTGWAERTIKRTWVRLFLVMNLFHTWEVALSIL